MEQDQVRILNIYTPSGIGDLHWTFIKLQGIKEELNRKIHVYYEANKLHQPKELLDMAQFVDFHKEDPVIDKENRFFHRYPPIQKLFNGNCNQNTFFLWIYRDIVQSRNIGRVMPNIKTNYDYDLKIPKEAKEKADEIIKQSGRPCIITNASWRSLDKNQVGNHWSIGKYIDTAKLFHDNFGIKTVLLGSNKEIDTGRCLNDSSPYFINLVAKLSLSEVIALISKCDLIWGFQGGLNMIADRFKRPIIMLWPLQKHTRAQYCALDSLVSSWVRPESIQTKRYVPLVLGKDVSPGSILHEAQRLLDGIQPKRLS